MDFREHLERICDDLDGAVAACLMGADGLPVEAVERFQDHEGIDANSLFVEYSSLLPQLRQSAEMFTAGAVEELCVRSEGLTAVIRPVTEEYFLALALRPGGNLGKGRYLLRLVAPQLVDELS